MQKKVGIIIIAIAFLLLAVIIYIFFISDYFFRSNAGIVPIVENEGAIGGTPPGLINTNEGQTSGRNDVRQIDINLGDEAGTGEPSRAQIEKKDLIRISMSFAERFGTYSNQSSFSNINSLKILMSANMKNWAEKYILEKKSQDYDASIYYGITTKAVSAEIKEYDDDFGFASIGVLTRRREASGTMNNYSNVFNQEVLIGLVKENGAWKIDSAFWQ